MGEPVRTIIVDNLDSFTWNLREEFARRGSEVEVWRNDAVGGLVAGRAASAGPCLIVLSPGPGSPGSAGCSGDLVLHAERARIPLFGVCLGLQVIVDRLGGSVKRAGEPIHGRASLVEHDGGPPFEGIPSPMPAARYHSLVAASLPDSLERAAHAAGAIMAVRHRRAPMLGVQFHPESILTPDGGRIIDNLLEWARRVSR